MTKEEALATAAKYGLEAEVIESYRNCDSWEETLAEWDIL